MDAASAVTLIEFFTTVGKLKHLKRTGWVKCGVLEPETVASHMYRMAVMGMMIPETLTVNKYKVMKMAIVHDMAEAVVGDITPHCGVSESDKYTLEKNALTDMTSHLPDQSIAEDILALWQEYEDNCTNEAKFVKDFDKFDMVLQAYEYENDQAHIGPSGLEQFFASTQGVFRTDLVKSWNQTLRLRRSEASTNVQTQSQ
ncbi:5'-deoxynucleotidase HDDC2-like [Watersipora subatra]|uniref:5'-deoxynucleotidase HDDC2-like n=1 Tax=Watersipora subatra TaxID=2589382 RepID=UPI00355B6B01